MTEARIQHFYDEPSGTLSYVVADERSGHAAIIDPVVGYSTVSGRIDASPSDVVIEYVHREKLGLEWILETHAHADHLTGAQYIKSQLGGAVAIGDGIRQVQAHFGPVFNLGPPFAADGHQFDRLFSDGDTFQIGELNCEVIATPGHTNDSVSYKIGSAVFVGDSMFMPDFGTARCDFPGGDAELLYDSIQRVLSLPADTRLFMCHDYMPGGRELRWECSVAEQRAENIHLRENASKSAFTSMRTERDASLNLPALIVPAIQVNIRAGHLPDAEDNDIAYIKTPIDTL
ncbi:MAG: MBL fold metallo-hydrolase [Gammaproteobacteria bacterium]|jgi:glyoxylase-like metal-dependent hydrolase (beta-lactamase superfamily II)|nr:MBL fold metallo-hydrolase [Gammaproteobacteria bacterium]MDH3749148.1 MBL fold metallo-hydrolase [Gammaproteobacteria bacterium]MDH3804622.1 MBL fold metallo-hydrolase [Gammaproteobacteria bacterium]